jgi:hypothetical protein
LPMGTTPFKNKASEMSLGVGPATAMGGSRRKGIVRPLEVATWSFGLRLPS